jgi:hypothetical protein
VARAPWWTYRQRAPWWHSHSRCAHAGDPCGIHSKGGAIGRFNQKWVDAFTKLGYIDQLHFQGDLVCGYRPGASSACLNRTAAMANSWRTTGDIRNNFTYRRLRVTSIDADRHSGLTEIYLRFVIPILMMTRSRYVMKNILQNNGYHEFGGPHHWNDPDLLVVGNPGTTVEEQITQMSLWCLTKAPLIISTDLRTASNTTINILSNRAAIAVNQDGARGCRCPPPRAPPPRRVVWLELYDLCNACSCHEI